MKKWEYRIIDSHEIPGGGVFKGKEPSEIDDYLNRLGDQGWEIVNLDFRELERRLEFTGVAKRVREITS